MKDHRYHQTRFLTGARELHQMPADRGLEVAFAGRSNTGKSSVINALTGRSKLARTSKTPGRTREINFFAVSAQARLVDLPGYGYARVPASLKAHWAATLAGYFATRTSLKGLVIIMDARRPLTAPDRQMLALARDAGCPVHIVLNKADKLPGAEGRRTLARARAELAPADARIQLFSALKGTGIDELRGRLDAWLFAG